MKKLIALSALTFASTIFAADVAYSPPVGGFTTVAAANSDTLVSPTLAREAAWRGTVSGATSSEITISNEAWTAGQFAPGAETYYIRLLSGSLAGQYFVVTGNTTNAVTVDAAGFDLSQITAGDSAEVVPFWTLGTLYPANQVGTAFIASANPLNVQTQLLFFDGDSEGINRASSAIYYFYNGAWRKAGASTALSFDNTIVFPDTYFIHRNKDASTTLVYVGRVQPGALGTVLEARSERNDNFVALSFPVDVTLNDSGLAAAITPSANPLLVQDQLLVFSSEGAGYNRAASAIYYY